MKEILYLGTSLSHFSEPDQCLHYPVIRIIPKTKEDERVRFCLNQLTLFSHCILTSKNSVEILWNLCLKLFLDPSALLADKCICIGPSTASALREKGISPLWQALDATQEGILSFFSGKESSNFYVFYPRSSLARPVLRSYLEQNFIRHEILDLYDTQYQKIEPIPDLKKIREIVFTSPSTVEGFFRIFHEIPSEIKLSFQGPITQKKFQERFIK